MNRLKLSFAVALALASSHAFALGLGPIQVKSKMNEPLSADIAVIEGEADEATGLKAQLASADDMKRVGIDSSGLAVPLTFTVVPGAKGRTVIHVGSNDAIREPFVSFLLEVNWGKGRVLREYNVLLDPPVVAPSVVGSRAVAAPVKEAERAPAKPIAPPVETKPAPAAAAPPAAAAKPETVPAKPTAKPAKPEAKAETKPEPKPEAKPAPPSQPAVAAGGDYGPVASGETLWEIAARTRPERAVGVNQMMVALLNANPQAFYRENVNALKRGAVLRIPGSDEVRKLSPAEAAAAVTAQNQAWAGGNAAPPVKVADSGKPAAAPAPAPAAAAAAPKSSRLELVPPKTGSGKSGADKPGAAGGTDSAAVRADLLRVKEQLTSKEQEATELRSRVSDLEKIKADNDKLISLKNSQIAELQQKLAELNRQIDQQKRELAKVQAAPAKPEAAAKPEPAKPEPSKPEPVAPAVTATPPTTAAKAEVTPSVVPPAAVPTAPEATKPEAGKPEAAAPATEPKVTPLPESKPAKPVPMPETPTAPAPATESWFENPLVLGGIGILLILGAGALFLGRRRKAEPEPEPVEMEAPSLGDQFTGGPLGRSAAAPVLTADDEERALLEQLARDPTDEDSHLDLLRTYYLRNDAEKFEHAAHAFYAQHPSAAGWQRAADMGRELMPDNMLFAQAAAGAGQAAEAAVAEDAATGHDLDFDFGLAAKDEKAEAAPETAPVKFDFDITPPPPSRLRPEPEPEPEPEVDFESPSVALEPGPETEAFRLEGEPKPAPAAGEATQMLPVSDLDFTLETPKPALATAAMRAPDFMGEDAVGTKLDLARAYLDMGDPDGARSMLQEVLSEGSAAQQDEARKLLTELG